MFTWWMLLACKTPEAPPPAKGEPFEVTESSDPDALSPLVFDGAPPNNLLMISIDTLRKDQIGFYGGGADTPYLDSLLAGSVHLDDHMQCSSWTYASMSCTLMGRTHEANGYMPRLTQLQNPIPPTSTFLAEWLSDAGFLTMLHSSNEWLSAVWGNTRGYAIEVNLGGDAQAAAYQAADLLQAEVDARGAERWALHLHFVEPHAPYNPPDEYLDALDDLAEVPFDLSNRDVHYSLNRDTFDDFPPAMRDAIEAHLRARYLGELAFLDDKLEVVFADLERRGMLDDTLVVIFTDHGEAFWEHGHQTHGWDLFPEENDAVLAFMAPGLAPRAWTGPTHAIDMAPTLLSVWDLPIPDTVDGIVLGHASDDRVRYASVAARAGPVQLIQQGDDALYFTWREGTLIQIDRSTDPGAFQNVGAPGSARTQELWELMRPWTQALDPLIDSDNPLIPPGYE